MTQEQDKALLAEFMGWELYGVLAHEMYINKNIPGCVPISSNMIDEYLFNDYNSIMEVVEKIEKGRSYIVRICGNTCQIEDVRDDFCIAFKMCNTKNEAILSACVAFVKWWNENKKEAK